MQGNYLHNCARSCTKLRMIYIYIQENMKTNEAEKKIDDKNHPIIKKSYLKIWSLDEKIVSIGELLDIKEASCPLGELGE